MLTTMIYRSPVGDLIIGDADGAICLCNWIDGRRNSIIDRRIEEKIGTSREGSTPLLLEAISQLDEYFAGKRTEFSLPLRFCGTEFQNRVYRTLTTIPYGETRSYAVLAAKVGRSKAVRAVASANATNPISILVPCHRVISSDGSLGGYSGGLSAKCMLLNLERDNIIGAGQSATTQNHKAREETK